MTINLLLQMTVVHNILQIPHNERFQLLRSKIQIE